MIQWKSHSYSCDFQITKNICLTKKLGPELYVLETFWNTTVKWCGKSSYCEHVLYYDVWSMWIVEMALNVRRWAGLELKPNHGYSLTAVKSGSGLMRRGSSGRGSIPIIW